MSVVWDGRDDPDGSRPLEPGPLLQSPLLEIANATVRLYKATFGRGPTQARARFAGSDTLVVVLHETMTVSERRLAAMGEHDRLREHRLVLHRTLEQDMRAMVERLLARPTVALITGIDTERDIAAELIMLAPAAPPVP
jgi:uncharacterized protein YbcI